MIRDLQIDFQSLVYRSSYPQDIVKKANISSNLIQELFLRLLLESKKKIGGKIMKVCISLTKDEKQINLCCSDEVYDVSVVFLELPFKDLDEYFTLSSYEKSDFLLKSIVRAFQEISKKTETIDLNLINAIAEKCKEDKFINQYYFGKLRSAKNRKHKAGIWVEHEMETLRIYLDILDKEEHLLKRELVSETEPLYPKYYPLLGGVKWTDNDNVELFNRKREVLKTITI